MSIFAIPFFGTGLGFMVYPSPKHIAFFFLGINVSLQTNKGLTTVLTSPVNKRFQKDCFTFLSENTTRFAPLKTTFICPTSFPSFSKSTLTAKSEDTDKVLGLTVGADDYVTKPFNPVELQARVKSQIRRYMLLGAGNTSAGKLVIGGIELDDKSKTVTVDGEAANLTRTEYDILKLLMEHPGEVYSPNQIYAKVWKDEPYGTENTVAVHIRHLREKVEINPAEPRYLKVIWGRGYKIDAE